MVHSCQEGAELCITDPKSLDAVLKMKVTK